MLRIYMLIKVMIEVTFRQFEQAFKKMYFDRSQFFILNFSFMFLYILHV